MPRAYRVPCAGAIAFAFSLLGGAPAAAQFATTEAADFRLVYLDPTQRFLVPHAGRCLANALDFHRELFDYTPWERITLFLTDFSDVGNAGATSVPRDVVSVRIAPMSFAFETFTANERMNYLLNHELAHVVTMDQAAGSDLLFRRLFQGKPAPVPEHPESIAYFYLTSPRVATPRWYLEGIAVFLDTWMAGGLGRAQGPYDEMVFRAMVLDGTPFYEPLGLASELTKTDFRLEANSYLYGARFMNYLAYRHGPESLIRWVSRTPGSRAYYASQFAAVYGTRLDQAWRDWIAFEREFQTTNLAAIREHPVTAYADISRVPLGSLSRAYVDPDARVLYAGLNHPGAVGHVAAISLDDGSVRRIREIEQPRIYTVTSLAFDPGNRTLFYTADNGAYRDLVALDPSTGRATVLLRDGRIGDLAFNRADGSLWGVRTFNGFSTLVRIPPPYTAWKQVHSWPYGEFLYDLDVSPDGELVSASVGEINGRQSVRVMKTASLLAGDPSPAATFDFGTAIPSDFVFSPDGRFLYGSSYYTGVSNIFRYELATGTLEALTNAETGFFRPIPLGDDALLVFRYTGEGFVPTRIAARPLSDVSAITFLGERVVERHPVLKTWMAGSPARVPIESMVRRQGAYAPLRSLGLESFYPVVEGYKATAAYGLHVRFSDPILLNSADVTVSYSPAGDLEGSERVHVLGRYQRYNWTARAALNEADFYDLFGPTKTSRKGYSLGLGHRHTLVYDEPRRLDLEIDGRYAGNLDRLPQYQNVAVDVDRLLSAEARLSYSNLRGSLGHVDDEKGVAWSLALEGDYVNASAFTRARAQYDYGMPLALRHSSVWIRSAIGFSPQDADEPFANFYFGGFGNNYVDHRTEKRYREYYAFPGAALNEVGGRNFVRTTGEWNLPPLRFSHAGTPGFHATWVRPAVFAGVLATNLDAPGRRRTLLDLGAQLDLRLNVLSTLDLTVSVGGALALEDGRAPRREAMLSLKLLR